MNVSCPACGRLVAKEDGRNRRGKSGWLKGVNGARVRAVAGQAPRIKCACGHAVILLKGSV